MCSWTQPVCHNCFHIMRPDREPVRVKEMHTLKCCQCGANTNEGIFVRLNPNEVPYPMGEDE